MGDYTAGYLFAGQADTEVINYCKQEKNKSSVQCSCLSDGYTTNQTIASLSPYCIDGNCNSLGYKSAAAIEYTCNQDITIDGCKLAIEVSANDSAVLNNIAAACSVVCSRPDADCGIPSPIVKPQGLSALATLTVAVLVVICISSIVVILLQLKRKNRVKSGGSNDSDDSRGSSKSDKYEKQGLK